MTTLIDQPVQKYFPQLDTLQDEELWTISTYASFILGKRYKARKEVTGKRFGDYIAEEGRDPRAVNVLIKIVEDFYPVQGQVDSVSMIMLASLENGNNKEAKEEYINRAYKAKEEGKTLDEAEAAALKVEYSRAKKQKTEELDTAPDTQLQTNSADGGRDLIIEVKDPEAIDAIEKFREETNSATTSGSIVTAIKHSHTLQEVSQIVNGCRIETLDDLQEIVKSVEVAFTKATPQAEKEIERIVTAPVVTTQSQQQVEVVATAPLQNPKVPKEMSLEVFYQTHKNCMNVRALVSTKVEDVHEKLMDVYKILKGTVVTVVSDPITTVGNPIKLVMVRVAKDQPLLQIPMSWLMVYA